MEQYADEFERECAELRADIAALRARLEEVEGDAAAYKDRGDNHAETLRGVRVMLSKEPPDIKRALLWVSDGLFGYTEPLEATLLKANDERNFSNDRATRAEADLEIMTRARDHEQDMRRQRQAERDEARGRVREAAGGGESCHG